MYHFGGNPKAALYFGYNNRQIVVITHVIGGVLAALAGIIVMSRTNSVNPEYGNSYLLLAILIVVMGGINIKGGEGNLWGVFLAVFVLQLFSTGFNMLLQGIPGAIFFRDFLWGGLLLFIMIFNRILHIRRKGRSHTI